LKYSPGCSERLNEPGNDFPTGGGMAEDAATIGGFDYEIVGPSKAGCVLTSRK
jgi:hypothetical protein